MHAIQTNRNLFSSHETEKFRRDFSKRWPEAMTLVMAAHTFQEADHDKKTIFLHINFI